MPERDPSLRGIAEGHGSLATHRSLLDQLDFVVTAEDRTYRAPVPPGEGAVLGAAVAELHEAGEPVEVKVRAQERRVLEVVAQDEHGVDAATELIRFSGELDDTDRHVGAASLDSLAPGGYTLTVRAPDDPTGLHVNPVRATTLVWKG